jgi:cell division protein FtsX
VAVCAWFAGTSPTIAHAAADVTETDYHDLHHRDGEIFMNVNATPREIAAVRNTLRHDPALEAFAFLDHHDALAEARRIFKGDRGVVRRLTAAALPTSFRVRFAPHADRDSFQQQLELQQGVDEVKLRPTASERRATRAAAARDHDCRGDVDIEVFVTVNATAAQEDAVASALAATDGIESVERVSHETARSTYACLFPGRSPPAAETLPASFRLRVRTMAVVIALKQTVEHLPGVDSVQY